MKSTIKSVIDTFIIFSMIAAIPIALSYKNYRETERIRTAKIEEAVVLEVSPSRKAVLGYDEYRDVVLDINKNGKVDDGDAIVHTDIFFDDENVGGRAIVARHKYGVDLIAVDKYSENIESYKTLNSYGKYAYLLNEKFKEYVSQIR